ncbi:Thioredoxin-like fold [Phytophthora cactorum]|nr:Thioredoxin-like fold [Phytophthora cactorum]
MVLALIAAEFNSIDIELPEFDFAKDIKSKEFKAKTPAGKVPLLETDEGCIFESGAIAKYVARLRADTGLYGKTFFESGQVDAWIDFSAYELEVPLEAWSVPDSGLEQVQAAALTKAKADITLADIFIASALVYPFKFVLDKEFRKPYSVNRWFSTLVNQPEFQAVVGDVPLIDVALTAEAQLWQEGCQEGRSQEGEGRPQEEAPKPKKVEHPLAVLNREKPSSLNLDAWKVQYRTRRTWRTP